MYKLINADEAVGKIVEEVKTDDEYTAILLTDVTALVVKSVMGWHGEYVESEICEDIEDIDLVDRVALNLITDEEYESMAEKVQERRQNALGRHERAELERLQKKYGESK